MVLVLFFFFFCSFSLSSFSLSLWCLCVRESLGRVRVDSCLGEKDVCLWGNWGVLLRDLTLTATMNEWSSKFLVGVVPF